MVDDITGASGDGRIAGGLTWMAKDDTKRLRGLAALTAFVTAAAERVRPQHELQCADFDTVVATSDFHADFPKTMQLLRDAGLIALPPGLDPWEHRYNPRLVTETTWRVQRTLLVVCGDIVDGVRPSSRGSSSSVDDPEGSFELRLHCLLFNLRILAEQGGSAVLFTVGNHDMHTVLRNDDLWQYVSEAATGFFGGQKALKRLRSRTISPAEANAPRSAALSPFYACSPYLMLSLQNESPSPEVVFVHGGLRIESRSIYDETKQAQEGVDAAETAEARLTQLKDSFPNDDTGRQPGDDPHHVTWRREYAKTSRCESNQTIQNAGCELIVVGHCTTDAIADLREQNQCEDAKGCLLLACEDEHAARDSPLIALVDTAMSACFHNDAQAAKERPTQMLLLRKKASRAELPERAVCKTTQTTTYNVCRLWVGPEPLLERRPARGNELFF
jgi:hypothetical protein